MNSFPPPVAPLAQATAVCASNFHQLSGNRGGGRTSGGSPAWASHQIGGCFVLSAWSSLSHFPSVWVVPTLPTTAWTNGTASAFEVINNCVHPVLFDNKGRGFLNCSISSSLWQENPTSQGGLWFTQMCFGRLKHRQSLCFCLLLHCFSLLWSFFFINQILLSANTVRLWEISSLISSWNNNFPAPYFHH